jgi:hypothetical protein
MSFILWGSSGSFQQLDYTASKGMITEELERIWKEAAVAQSTY